MNRLRTGSLRRRVPLLVIGSVFITVGAAMGPETKDVDFGEPAGVQQ